MRSRVLRNRNSLLTICGLCLYCLIIFLPPIIHGYVYPSVGDDTAVHLQVFDRMRAGDPTSSQFILSYKIVGYTLIWISGWTNWSIDTLFLWFSYLALAVIGLTIYLVVAKLSGRKAGWLALVLTVFCAQGLLFQFYYGQIFNAINMGIILPLLLYCTVKYITQRKVYYLVLALALAGLFGSFHDSGIYLPFFAVACTMAYGVCCLAKKRRVEYSLVALGFGLVLLPAVVCVLLVPGIQDKVYCLLSNVDKAMAVPLGSYLMGIVSPTILVLSVFVLVFFKDMVENIDAQTKVVVFMLLCMVVVLGVPAFTRLSLDPFRQALDLATVVALLIGVCVGALKLVPKNRVAIALVILSVGFGLYHNLPTWFDYNSTIRPADKEAIAYVNTINRLSYNCSPEVAPWIYDRFMVLAEYSEDVASILIVRNLPMTPRSNPENKWYEGHGFDIENYTAIYGDDSFDADYNLLGMFDDGEVVVRVYENVGNAYYVPLGKR